MSKMVRLAAGLAVLGTLTLNGASAAPINTPVPTDAYITFNGLDWAWASPCSPGGCFDDPNEDSLDLSFQGTQGWRLPTLAELQSRPAPSDFIFSGANVPILGGVSVEGTQFFGAPGDGACATAYFTDAFFNNCDYTDAVNGFISGLADPSFTTLEVWVVRGAAPATVPEPITLSLFGAGLAGAVAMRRRKHKITSRD